MKKYLFLLLCTVSIYGQTYQNPTFGTVTSKTNVEDNSAEKILVQNSLGKLNWIYKNSLIPNNFTKVVYVNNNNPNGATIFDLNNPPVTNDNLLKSDVNNLYIGTDASTWVYNATTVNYVTKTVTSNTSNFYLTGTSTDAGNSKTASIERFGDIKTSGRLTGSTVGIGTSSPIGKLDIFTGLSGFTSNVGAIPFGTISFGNHASLLSVPTIFGRSDNQCGIQLISGTNNTNPGPDMSFEVRKNDNSDFITLTSVAFRFSRFSNNLVEILRNGNTTFIGNVTAPAGTTANHVVIKSQLDLKANLASPAFTGNPTAPTPTAGDNDTSIVNSAFVTSAIATAISTVAYSGSYTPTYTAMENISSITHQQANYTVVGKIVTICISVSVTLTASANASSLRIAFPVSLQAKPTVKCVFSGSIFGVAGPTINPAASFTYNTSSVNIDFKDISGSNSTVTLTGMIMYEIN